MTTAAWPPAAGGVDRINASAAHALSASLVGEQLGLERVPIEVSHEGGTHRITVGGDGELEVQEIVPFGKDNDEPARLVGIFHPAGDDFAIAKASKSRISAFGMDFAFEGRSAWTSEASATT